MLRKIRIALALIMIAGITLLFLDFTGTLHPYLNWMSSIQLIPALMAMNVVVIAGLVVLTLLLGRVYCSVICPLGVMQDMISWLRSRSKKGRNRFGFSRAKNWLRFIVAIVFAIALFLGINAIAVLIEPYSAYGRIAQNILAPIWAWGNNILASISESMGNYTFAETTVWRGTPLTLTIAVVTLGVLAVMAWRGGRTYCNTICPVGSLLGFLSQYSWLKPVIDTSKCNSCGKCARRCKASCINPKEHSIDYTRCVACMDCLDNCSQGAISYTHPSREKVVAGEVTGIDKGRRSFMTISALFVGSAALQAQRKTVDGGLAAIADKQKPNRKGRIVPPGAGSEESFLKRCTACQQCVAVCPNGVLRPSSDLGTLMIPEVSYEAGYCRPECNKCSQVCPADAIKPIDLATKSSTQVGHAVWVMKNCVVVTDDVDCGNCARHCPSGAITMVAMGPGDDARKIPSVNTERCIGCGACENLCPARPFSAIYVEGHNVHRLI